MTVANQSVDRVVGNGVGIIEGEGTLTILIDTTAPGVPSASGKSMVLASTRGNVTLDSGVTIGINVYRKR